MQLCFIAVCSSHIIPYQFLVYFIMITPDYDISTVRSIFAIYSKAQTYFGFSHLHHMLRH